MDGCEEISFFSFFLYAKESKRKSLLVRSLRQRMNENMFSLFEDGYFEDARIKRIRKIRVIRVQKEKRYNKI